MSTRKSQDSRKSRRKSRKETKEGKADMESLTFYEILDVHPSADDSAIRKAYRRNAIKWHPDKNPDNKAEAEAMFKLVAEAYEVLSDPEKREVYDRYGKEGLQGGMRGPRNSFSGVDMNRAQNLFEQFFGNDPFFASAFGRGMGGGMGFEDPFSAFGGGGFGGGSRQVGRSRDPFESMFSSGFGQGFGDMGGFSSSMSSSSFGGGNGVSKSTRSTTTIVNGQRVTKTETTIRYPDGRVETTTDESTDDVAPRLGSGTGRSALDWF